MKQFFLIFSLFLSTQLIGQPIGKLFIHSGFVTNSELGYIQYPQNQYHTIEYSEIDDMIIVSNKLLTSNNKVYIYNTNTLIREDSINTDYSYMLGYDNNKLVISRTEPPFIKVFNYNTKNLIFSLDTNKVKFQPVDILVDLNKAYLLYDTSVLIIDLLLQDTIASIPTVDNNYPFWFPSYNQYLVNKGNKIYIDAEFATGAPRFAIFSLDKTTYQVENVLFKEFIDTPYEPVLADNKLYMSDFPSYYDITADTFYYFQNTNMVFPINYDMVGNAVFISKPLVFKVSYFHNGIYSQDVTIPSYINKSIYFNENTSVSAGFNKIANNNINIFPNPANNELNISFENEKWVNGIRIISLNGDSYVKIINSSMISHNIDISYLNDGIYLIEIQFDNQLYQSKFVKTSNK